MGLTGALARVAADRAHVLVVETPGAWRLRVRTEREALSRGWSLAVSPGDADVLVVCGVPGPGMREPLEGVWHQMPGPRVRAEIRSYAEVAASLDQVRADLRDTAHHRRDAAERLSAADILGGRDGTGDTDHGDMDHGGMDHGDMDHGGMDHGDMDMEPGGIPLAGGGEDRDGLEMDVLNVSLGPVLPHWPAGLVLRCSLQGDVITHAGADLLDTDLLDTDLLDTDQRGDAGHGPVAARRCDNVAAVLALAAWDDAAARARRVRDALLDGEQDVDGALAALGRSVRRSRLLRWSLRGIRPLSGEDLDRYGLPAHAAGDTWERLLGMLERLREGADSGGTVLPDQVAALVTGLDLATARLVTASLDIHTLAARSADHAGSHA